MLVPPDPYVSPHTIWHGFKTPLRVNKKTNKTKAEGDLEGMARNNKKNKAQVGNSEVVLKRETICPEEAQSSGSTVGFVKDFYRSPNYLLKNVPFPLGLNCWGTD